MADSQLNGTPTPMTEDQARRLISQNLAELLQKGSCTIRVAAAWRLKGGSRFSRRIIIAGRPARAWTITASRPSSSWTRCSPSATSAGKDVHIAVHNSGNHDEITIGFHKEAVTNHRSHLAQYVMGQLFWD